MQGVKTLKVVQRPVAVAGSHPTTAQVLSCLPDRPGTVVLESLGGHTDYGRYSFVSFDPWIMQRWMERGDGSPFDGLQQRLAGFRLAPSDPRLPFVGGWMGVLSYEAAMFLEELPWRARRDLGLPLAWFGFYDTVAIQDHADGQWYVAGVELPAAGAARRAPLERRLDDLEALLNRAARRSVEAIPSVSATPRSPPQRSAYLRKVQQILRHIRAGDIYQANLAERFEIPLSCDSLTLYRRLRVHNPADFMAYIHCGDHQVLSSSPELFLRVRGETVLTRPIKGTRPRSAEPAADRAAATELLASEKDLAELAMIVDVQRNDLGRVCSQVTADWPPVIESFKSVHHLVATVWGTLARSPAASSGWSPSASSPIDVLRAAFPGGSITGAPKIRAMEIIDQLEAVARGPYCGSIGFIGLDGDMSMNIAIRTMVVKHNRAYIHAGSGIVADSEPDCEWREILAKAEALFAALGIAPGPAPDTSVGDLNHG